MRTFFIEENKKIGLFQRFRKITQKNNRILINKKIVNLSLKNKAVIVKKIKNILERENVRQVVIESNLKQDVEFINLLQSNNINICNSKWVLKKCTDKVVDLVLKEKKKEESEIWICVNEVDSLVEEYIYKFAKEFRRINIITNHIGKFKKIEEKIYNEEGILINVTNNRRKSLLKAELIINVDFPKEIINEFAIYDRSTIINWDEPLKIRKKRFNGKIIEEIKINLDIEGEIVKVIEENELKKYDERDICQAFGIIPNNICINWAKLFYLINFANINI